MGISWGYTYISNRQYFQKGCVCKPEKKSIFMAIFMKQIDDLAADKLATSGDHSGTSYSHLLRLGGIREYPMLPTSVGELSSIRIGLGQYSGEIACLVVSNIVTSNAICWNGKAQLMNSLKGWGWALNGKHWMGPGSASKCIQTSNMTKYAQIPA